MSQQRLTVALFSVHCRTVQALHTTLALALALFCAQQAAEQAAAASVSVGAMMKLVSPVMLRQVEVSCMTAAEHAIAAGAE